MFRFILIKAIYVNKLELDFEIKIKKIIMNPFDSKNPDRFSLGGEIEEYKKQGILDLNFYPTNSKHAKEHGIDAKNPLYLQNLIVKEKEYIYNIVRVVWYNHTVKPIPQLWKCSMMR